MWKLRPTDDFERQLKFYRKKHERELEAVLDNLDTYFKALSGGTKPKQALANFGFVHAEPSDVVAVTEKGHGAALAATRLYAYPDITRETLYLITIGDKRSQRGDIAICKDFVKRLPKLVEGETDEEESHERRPDGPGDD